LDSENGYYITNNILLIAKRIIKKDHHNIIYMAILSIVITLLIIKYKLSMLKIKYIYEFDSMTDVYNRRAGYMRLGKCITNIIANRIIGLCFIDVNGLKEVNDKIGHNVGDELIISVVNKIKENIREDDFIIRLGGDEFLIVLPRTSKDDAEKVWERITKSYEEINAKEERPYIISVSHGMAEIHNTVSEDGLEELITQADDRMYEEKREIKAYINVIR
jgi:diguanylate cyclase (GGDEF)-like protein